MILMFLSQLYDAQELQMYNKCMNELRKTTASSLNAVAVALLNKVSLLSPCHERVESRRTVF